MRKTIIFLLLIVLICVFTNASVHANVLYSNGWYSIKNDTINNCVLDNIWVSYQDGVEVSKYCKMILAHRGWGDAPENSLEAIKHVKDNGYFGFETDIYFTKDNIPVLSHDETINRIARNNDFSKIKEKKYIKDMTYDELLEYSFVVSRTGKVLKKYLNNRITLFEEALKYSKDNNMFIAIELKDGNASQIASLVQMVKKYKMSNNVRWLSFNPGLLKYVIDEDKEEDLQLLCLSDYHNDCYVNSRESYCGTEEEREYFNKLLNTGKNHVYMKGNKQPNTIGQGTIITSNLPENNNKYPTDENRIDPKLIDNRVYVDVIK